MSTHNTNRFDSEHEPTEDEIRAAVADMADHLSSRREHDAPQESVHLLRAELDACREEIASLRRAMSDQRRYAAALERALGFTEKGWL